MVKSAKAEGPWSEPVLVKEIKGIIDTCPLWDEDGKVYLAHAYAGSRAGLKSVISVCELNAGATKAIGPSRIIFDGHEAHQTCEGPKLYKKDGYYYIFLPAGGVATGWQVVLRSKNIYGPYESRTVLAQGSDTVIEIMDNGSGVPADQLEQVQKTMREGNDDPEADIGLRNVYMRLNYFYGKGFQMEIGNNPEGGFKISILIPGKVEEDVHIGDRG